MSDKAKLREKIWTNLEARGYARFPGARGRIPNFDGAVDAARRLDEVPVWREAGVVKCNPDYAQVHVRARAFHEGKVLYMARPRLRQEACFLELDPARIDENPWKAVTIKGSARLGRPVRPEEIPEIDLIVCGSVAVSRDGARVGKGGGYSDLEYALGRELGIIQDGTPALTTVHPIQVVDEEIEPEPHDFPLDWIVTPEEAIRTRTELPRPRGIDWEQVDDAMLEEIPVLARLAGPGRQ